MKRIGSILLWSAIAAAFIGPGTVTAAASAGANTGAALLWAILFSGIATFTLQEFAGRLAVATGDDLATVLRRRYPTGFAHVATLLLVGGAILLFVLLCNLGGFGNSPARFLATAPSAAEGSYYRSPGVTNVEAYVLDFPSTASESLIV